MRRRGNSCRNGDQPTICGAKARINNATRAPLINQRNQRRPGRDCSTLASLLTASTRAVSERLRSAECIDILHESAASCHDQELKVKVKNHPSTSEQIIFHRGMKGIAGRHPKQVCLQAERLNIACPATTIDCC